MLLFIEFKDFFINFNQWINYQENFSVVWIYLGVSTFLKLWLQSVLFFPW